MRPDSPRDRAARPRDLLSKPPGRAVLAGIAGLQHGHHQALRADPDELLVEAHALVADELFHCQALHLDLRFQSKPDVVNQSGRWGGWGGW